MELIGQSVTHIVFGSGIITALSESVVTVCFQSIEKRFIYPDSFCSYMKLDALEAQMHVEGLFNQQKLVALQARQAAQAAQERKNKLLNYQITKNSHAIFNVPENQAEEIIKSGQIYTGSYLSGASKGLPRLAERIKPNSLCVLTSLADDEGEQERRVRGVFMVKEDFFGSDAQDGIVAGHSCHRLFIQDEVRVHFWEYFGQSAPTRWGNTKFKYCSGDVLNKMLADIVALLGTSEQKEAAISLYKYFCHINRLRQLIKLE